MPGFLREAGALAPNIMDAAGLCRASAGKDGLESMRVKIVLACTECKQRNYLTKKNKKNDPDRREMY